MVGLLEAVTKFAASQPSQVALRSPDEEVCLTYAGLRERAFGLLSMLDEALGSSCRGQVIGVCADSSVVQCVATTTLVGSDAVYANLNPAATDDGLRRTIAALRPAAILTDRWNAARVRDLWPASPVLGLDRVTDMPSGRFDSGRLARPDEVGVVAFTSGTTGLPKGCVHRNRAISEHCWAGTVTMGFCRESVVTTVPTLAVTNFMSSVGIALYTGGVATVLSHWDPEVAVRAIDQFGCSYFLAVPTTLLDLVEVAKRRPEALRCVRIVWSGAAPLPPGGRESWQAISPAQLVETYGMIDAPGLITVDSVGGPPGRAGWPMPRVELRILDVSPDPAIEWKDVQPGTLGRIAFGGPSFTRMVEYFGDEARSARCLRDDWVLTDDLGRIDDKGCLHVVGRSDDVILRGGSNVHPLMVESVLAEHPGLSDAVVIGVPDARLGSRLVAGVVLGSPGEPAAVLEWANARLARYERLAQVVCLDRVERDPLGKIRRRMMRDEVLRRLGNEDSHGR